MSDALQELFKLRLHLEECDMHLHRAGKKTENIVKRFAEKKQCYRTYYENTITAATVVTWG
jgi:hypothetical protein